MSDIFRDFFVKEKPVFTGIARGFGGFSFGGSSGPGGFTASGGTKSTDGDFTFHYFTTSTPAPERNFTLSGEGDVECDVICVAGGGGGAGGFGTGGYAGGGGGAGGVTMHRVTLVNGTPYTVTIGDGGTAGPVSAPGGTGGDSTFGPGSPFPFLSKGGGGGVANREPVKPGGSGGGGGGNSDGRWPGGDVVEGTVPSGGVRLGTIGGRSCNPSDPFMSGGGGGATGSGGPGGDTWPLDPKSAEGGRGLGRTLGWYMLPTSFAASGDFAGGGAGAGWNDTGPGTTPFQVDAFEGGGAGRSGQPLQLAGAGTANSGGGGAGGSAPGTPADAQKGGAGGSGFVVVRYRTSTTASTIYPAPSDRSFADVGGGIEITDSGRQYNIFIGPGTLTVNSPGEAYYLVVAGGASGTTNGGGGGAGGVRCNDPNAPILYNRGVPFTLTSPQPITVGAGGDGGPYPFAGTNGADSSIGTLVVASAGGKGGLSGSPSPFGEAGGYEGGSAGGGGYPDGAGATAVLAPPSPDPGVNTSRFQGFHGHYSEVPGHYGGGGGSGYSGAHQDGETAGPPGIGGDAAAFPGFPAPVLAPAIPSPVRPAWSPAVGPQGYFAGGGAGGDQNGGPNHPGGRGGGGDGGTPGPGSAAVDFTGSGGGGSAGGSGVSGAGGDGIVIIVTEV